VERLELAAREAGTRIVIVSGRRLVDLRGPLARIPHEEVWATHGWERLLANGARLDYDPGPSARRQLMLAEPAARRLWHMGARVERKNASVAIHWRGLPDAHASYVREAISSYWGEFDGDVEMLPFDGGMELRARGRTKGDAVREAMSESAPGTVFAYLGDDFTDEDAFEAVGASGAAVLVRPELRPSQADMWLRPPDELLAFLDRWCEAGMN
jgi:trehalose-phosphatase